MKAAIIIVAGGAGTRAGDGPPKAYRVLAGKPVITWSLEAFDAVAEVELIVAVIRPDHEPHFRAAAAAITTPVRIAYGGASRTASVRAGLAAIGDDAGLEAVLVHDAARPRVDGGLIGRVLAALQTHQGAAPAIPVADALKVLEAGPDGSLTTLAEDVDRAGVRAVQTPQGFDLAALRAAYAQLPEDADLSDDVAALRAAGGTVAWVDGARENVKLTYAEDFDAMERALRPPALPRIAVGQGFDVHRLTAGTGLHLCGVFIPGPLALVGHSDADVALHAVTDAILGAIGAGDIGDHFPPSDPQWAGADSARFLSHAATLAAQAGARVAHVDLTVICERPKVKPYRDAMRARLADILGIRVEAASVKATTTERLGFTGRGEGIAAQAVATVVWE